jgi:thioredoxin-like negative regulator of GroEL
VLTAAGGLNAAGLSLDTSDAANFILTFVGKNLGLSVPEPRCLILAILGFFGQHGMLVRGWRRKSQHYA